VNWKRYLGSLLRPHLGRRVLEVGAGIGANVASIDRPGVVEWVCLEPDADMAARIRERVERHELPSKCRVVAGAIDRLAAEDRFDTILYVDVLEHIGDDAGELRRASAHLGAGGRLAVLSPAHQFLFTPFDAAIGHYRRYSKRGLLRLAPPQLTLVDVRMIDSFGLLASLANKLLLRSSMPSEGQVLLWDRVLVPLSRVGDRLSLNRIGKSVLAVWGRG
jgi:SAM-dependent methyltransferase